MVFAEDDLHTVLEDAIKNDPQWRSAVRAHEASFEKLPQAKAALLPKFEISGSKEYNKTRYDTINGLAHFEPRFYSFPSYYFQASLTQPIFRWDKNVTYRQADFDRIAADAQLQKDRLDFLLRVIKAYFDVAASVENLAAANRQVTEILKRQKISVQSYKIGIGNITEVAESEARFEIAKAQETSAKRDLHIAKAYFQAIVGRQPSASLRLLHNDIQIAQPTPLDEEQWVKNASINAPDVLKKMALYEKARLEIERQRSGHYPTVDAVLSRTWNGSDHTASTLEGFHQNKVNFGILFKIPVFSGFSVTSLVREAISLQSKSFEDMEYAKKTSAYEASDSYSRVVSGLIELDSYRRALKNSQKSHEANLLGYKVGIRSNIDVLNSEQQIYTVSLQFIKAKYDALYYSMKLKSSVGELNDTDFFDVNKLFQLNVY